MTSHYLVSLRAVVGDNEYLALGLADDKAMVGCINITHVVLVTSWYVNYSLSANVIIVTGSLFLTYFI